MKSLSQCDRRRRPGKDSIFHVRGFGGRAEYQVKDDHCPADWFCENPALRECEILTSSFLSWSPPASQFEVYDPRRDACSGSGDTIYERPVVERGRCRFCIDRPRAGRSQNHSVSKRVNSVVRSSEFVRPRKCGPAMPPRSPRPRCARSRALQAQAGPQADDRRSAGAMDQSLREA
jgi:hypothetical protein